MAVPVLQLNLAPRPSLWRQRHKAFGWAAVAIGSLLLLGSIGFTWRAYSQASRAGRDAVSLTEEAKRASRQEQQLQSSLQDMDAGKEQARWKVAEKILQERSLPWSRLTAELEQCMVPDMRLKGIQRARSNTQQVVMKLKGEARTREAEAAFVEALRSAPVFAQVVLEREAERNGGGWDFELSLPAATIPPPFKAKAIIQGPAKAASAPAPAPIKALPKPPPPSPTHREPQAQPGPPQYHPVVPPPEEPVRRRPGRARVRPNDERDPE